MAEIIIIGAGPGGCAAAFAAARAGAKVTLVDRGDMGGTCLNRGCIPTKTLKASADALETASRLREFGIETCPPPGGDAAPLTFGVNMAAVAARKEKVRQTLAGGLEKTCAALGVRRIRGQARLLPGRKLEALTADGVETLGGDAVILATGSTPLDLPSLPADHVRVLSSDDALNLAAVPRRVLVVGGGVIGCEFAFILRAFGAQVTLVEGLDRLLPLPSVDADISRLLQREAKKRGLQTLLAQTLKDVSVSGGAVTCRLGPSPFVEGAAGPESSLEVDAVLTAVGRAPTSRDLHLDEVGVKTDGRGWIIADDGMRTTAEGIYAIGDALGPDRIMLAHAAAAEGLCAVANCLGDKTNMDYGAVPGAIFTTPEIGVVGLTEAQARESGRAVRSSLVQIREMGKAHAMGELAGFFKLVCEEGSGRILGAHIAGAHASDLIAEATLAVASGCTCRDLAGVIHAHPTLAEGLQEAAAVWLRG
jgi:dihydrolipoamide dehydrogenase